MNDGVHGANQGNAFLNKQQTAQSVIRFADRDLLKVHKYHKQVFFLCASTAFLYRKGSTAADRPVTPIIDFMVLFTELNKFNNGCARSFLPFTCTK